MRHRLYTGYPAISVGRPVDLGPAHVLSRTKRCTHVRSCVFLHYFYLVFVCFVLLDSVGQLLPAHDVNILPTQFYSTNGPVRWLPSRLVNHQQQQQRLLLQYPLLQHLLSIVIRRE